MVSGVGGLGNAGGAFGTGMASAIEGMQKAMRQNGDRAGRIAKASLANAEDAAANPESGDITQDMAEMKLDPALLKANTATVKTQDEMLGALLDLFA